MGCGQKEAYDREQADQEKNHKAWCEKQKKNFLAAMAVVPARRMIGEFKEMMETLEYLSDNIAMKKSDHAKLTKTIVTLSTYDPNSKEYEEERRWDGA